MKKIFFLLLIILTPTIIAAQTDGTIVEQAACPPKTDRRL